MTWRTLLRPLCWVAGGHDPDWTLPLADLESGLHTFACRLCGRRVAPSVWAALDRPGDDEDA